MARSSECTEQYAQKVFDSAGIVREAILQQRSASGKLKAGPRGSEYVAGLPIRRCCVQFIDQ